MSVEFRISKEKSGGEMKQYTIYECENCGKKSKDKTEIIKCEAAHLNLSEDEYQKWEELKQNVRYASHIVSTCKNEQTDKEFDDAIDELMDFEKLHGIEEEDVMSKLRVWWIPQVGNCDTFYVPVKSVEEGKRLLDTLAAYDAFQLQNKVKPDYCNVGGLQILDEAEGEWNDWYLETEDDFFDDVDEYCESDSCDQKEELQAFNQELFKQIDWNKMP